MRPADEFTVIHRATIKWQRMSTSYDRKNTSNNILKYNNSWRLKATIFVIILTYAVLKKYENNGALLVNLHMD